MTIVGSGNFSSPVIVSIVGDKKSDNSVAVGVAVTIVIVVILLTIVAGLLSAYIIRRIR